jgi:dolichol kinase
VTSAVVAIAMLRLLPRRGWVIAAAGAFALSGWTMEIARRFSPKVNDALMRFFAPVAHPAERHRVNSSTWYVSALLLLAIVAPPRAGEVGVLVLGVADPVAGAIGRRYGRTKLRADRSLEGTLAFLVAGSAAAFAWLVLASSSSPSTAAITACTAAFTGGFAELFSMGLDDNFTIPVVATAAVALVQSRL